jgi:hypothetical protein
MSKPFNIFVLASMPNFTSFAAMIYTPLIFKIFSIS